MKGAPLDLIAFKASATSVMPLMPAGSLFGPIKTKSLYMTGYRFTPKPSATNFSSASLACTKTTSASPRRPVSSALPVPCATTFTSMPVLALKSGRMWPNRPESCVDVVEATTMDLSCARAGAAATSVMVAAKTTRLRRVGMIFSSSCAYHDTDDGQTSSSPAVNRRASSVLGAEKKASAGALSITRPRCTSTISPASRLASPRSWVDITTLMPLAATLRITSSIALVAAGSRLAVGSSSRRICGSLASARASASRCCSPPESLRAGRRSSPLRPSSAPRPRHAGGSERIADIARGTAAQHRRPLEHDCAMRGRRLLAAAPAHAPARGRDQPHDKPQQRGLACAVRADQHRGRSSHKRKRDALDDRHTAGGEARVFEHDREIGDGRAHGHPANRSPARRKPQAAALTTTTRAISTRPSPMASGRSPFEVSSAIAVVMVRVKPSMLPPTMSTAPTSAAARPKPASSAVTRLKRPSQISVAMRPSGPTSIAASSSRYSLHKSSTVCRVSAAMIGAISTVCDDHRLRGEQKTPRPERPGARQQEIDGEPDDDGGQSHECIEDDDHSLVAGKARQRDGGAKRHADESAENDGRQTDDERQPHNPKQRRIAAEQQLKRRNLAGHGPPIPPPACCIPAKSRQFS